MELLLEPGHLLANKVGRDVIYPFYHLEGVLFQRKFFWIDCAKI
jgi:hypothetical protein